MVYRSQLRPRWHDPVSATGKWAGIFKFWILLKTSAIDVQSARVFLIHFFRLHYYFFCNEFTRKETGKMHLCALVGICRGSAQKVCQIEIHFSSVLLNSYLSLGGLMARTPAGDRDQTLPEETNFCIFWTLYFLQFQLCYAHIFSIFKTEGFQFAFPSVFEMNKNLQF